MWLGFVPRPTIRLLYVRKKDVWHDGAKAQSYRLRPEAVAACPLDPNGLYIRDSNENAVGMILTSA